MGSMDPDQALERLRSRTARFTAAPGTVEHHLYDVVELRAAFESAGLESIETRGLLIDWTTRPRDEAMQRLTDSPSERLDLERRLSTEPQLADLGKQLLAVGRRPA